MDPTIHVASEDEAMEFIADKCGNDEGLKSALEASYKKAELYEYEEPFRTALSYLDVDADISFLDKHFVLTGYGDAGEAIAEKIHMRGGIFHRKMLKKADYLVVYMETPGTAKLREALMWRESGGACKIVSDYQLTQAFKSIPPIDPAILRQREAEALEQEAKRREAVKMAVLEREQRAEARRQLQEENLRRTEEMLRIREEERRKVLEAKQKIAEENQRLKAEKEQAKAEKERLAAEAKAQKEQARQAAIANAVIIYAPGEEPANIRKRLDTLFAKLDGAYPDRKISGLNKNHKKWGETVTELYRVLGYADSHSFLEAYGYTVEENIGGRPTKIDPMAIIEELRRRYPESGAESVDVLKRDNPDIPWKTLMNNAREYYGNTLSAYLKTIGIVTGTVTQAPKQKQNNNPPSTSEKVDKVLRVMDENSAPSAQVDVTASELKYLTAIEQLSRSGFGVRAVDVANALGCSGAAVSNAMKKLKEKSLISVSAEGAITLLKASESLAQEKTENPFVGRTDLTTSERKYLTVIKKMQDEGISVRAVDIANVIGVSRASVSMALKKLKEKGLVNTQMDGSLGVVEEEGK